MNPRDIRLIILEQSKRVHIGHIGSALSIAEIIAALYGRTLRISRYNDPERDRFVLSKGHAALALYAELLRDPTASDSETKNKKCCCAKNGKEHRFDYDPPLYRQTADERENRPANGII